MLVCCISVLLCVFIFTRNVSGLQGLIVVVGAVGVLVPVVVESIFDLSFVHELVLITF